MHSPRFRSTLYRHTRDERNYVFQNQFIDGCVGRLVHKTPSNGKYNFYVISQFHNVGVNADALGQLIQ